jgi:hypothetical protein
MAVTVITPYLIHARLDYRRAEKVDKNIKLFT